MVSLWTCIFTLLLKLQFIEGLLGGLNPTEGLNPGSEVNFYGDFQKNSPLTPLTDLLFGFQPRDCTKAPRNSTCIVDLDFNDPNLPCQILDHPGCDPAYPYRHFDGRCNNLFLPDVGKSGNCFLRFIAPVYDGYDGMRKAMSGSPLPEPRNISLQLFKNYDAKARNVTVLYVLFGQVIAHDLVRAVRPFKIDCCAPENSNKPECWPIKVSPDDPKIKKNCIDFHRTEECKCKGASRAQKNGATAGMDLSVIYGETDEKAARLRKLDGSGELKHENRTHLPIVGKDEEDEFCYKGEETKCLLTGDPRVNQHASLGSFQTVFLREHNRIAEKFKQMHPDWDEEKLFQESRKINIAEYQCIAYKHFFPPLLSVRVMKQFKIYIEDGSAGTDYNPSAVLEAWNDFGVASYRLHTLVSSDIGSGKLHFKNTFSNPRLIRQGKASTLLKNASNVPMEKYDNNFVDDITTYLYKKDQDLVSINIQRGRDHGLPPYVDAIPFCSGQSLKVEKFQDLWELGLMTEEKGKRLSDIYQNVEDIDLWVGMNMEKRMKGSLLGPTAVCINAKQTFFTAIGDRYFFNHQSPGSSFTAEERTELKKCSLARLLCDNTMNKKIAKDPFHLPSNKNPVVDCEKIPKINLNIFKGSDKGSGIPTEIPEISTPIPNVSNLPGGLPV